jgi:hypothetical protein
MRDQIAAIEGEYRRYKALGEAAMGQLSEEELSQSPKPKAQGPNPNGQPPTPNPDDEAENAIAAIVAHLDGNLSSRFTDFLTSDGEKPWRNREDEFVARVQSRADVMAAWNHGWDAVLGALAGLTDKHLFETITIRSQPLRVDAALYRSLAHTSYHVGQIVYIAKAFRGADWKSLSIPKGKSAAYAQNPRDESPAGHVEHLSGRTRGT